jgi:hypothetical protein
MTTLDADDFELSFGAVFHARTEFNPANAYREFRSLTG